MTAPTPAQGPPGPMWTVAAVARRLGVSPGTLRSWGRRYGIGPLAHIPGRHRRYTAADLAEIEAIRALVARGMALPAAAAIVRSQRPCRTADGHARVPGDPDPVEQHAPRNDPVTELIAAATRLDLDTACTVVAASLAEQGVVTTWDRVCRPALTDLDATAAHDRGCTDAQLLMSWVITTGLRRFAVGLPTAGRPVLLACAAREQHTLPMEALFAALVERQVPAAMLGPAVPRAALLHAAHQLQPVVVVVWAQCAATAASEVLGGLEPHTEVVIAAGPGWHYVPVSPSVVTADDLQTALALADCTGAILLQ